MLLQGQLRRAGIELRMDNVAATQFFADRITKGDFDIADYAWTGTPFAVSANTSIWVSRGGQNFTGYANPTVDRLFAQANAALDEATAVRLSNDIDRQLWADMVSVPLYQKPTLLAFSDRYANIRDNPTSEGPFFNVGEWGLRGQ